MFIFSPAIEIDMTNMAHLYAYMEPMSILSMLIWSKQKWCDTKRPAGDGSGLMAFSVHINDTW